MRVPVIRISRRQTSHSCIVITLRKKCGNDNNNNNNNNKNNNNSNNNNNNSNINDNNNMIRILVLYHIQHKLKKYFHHNIGQDNFERKKVCLQGFQG